MRRYIVWTIFIVLLCFLANCSEGPNEPTGKEQTTQEHVHDAGSQEQVVDSSNGKDETTQDLNDAGGSDVPQPGEPSETVIPESSPENTVENVAEQPDNQPVEKPGNNEVVIPETHDEKVPEKSAEAALKMPATGGKVCWRRLCIVASAKALGNRPMTFMVRISPHAAPKGSLFPPYDVGPDNWKPLEDISLIFNYSGLTLPAGTSQQQLRVGFVDKTGKWDIVPSTVNPRGSEVIGKTNHLSTWGLLIEPKACQKNTDCQQNEVCKSNKCEKMQCPGGLKACSWNCVNTTSDRLHCGGCNKRCPTGKNCNRGQCS